MIYAWSVVTNISQVLASKKSRRTLQHNAAITSLRKELADQSIATQLERGAKDDAWKLAVKNSSELEKALATTGYASEQLRLTLTSKNASIVKLNKRLEGEKINAKSAYHLGFTAGHRAATMKAQPPPLPSQPTTTPWPKPTINVVLRESWLNRVMLQSTTGPGISSALKHALILGDKQTVVSVLATNPRADAPALHIAALFGDVEIARALTTRGAHVNSICNARSEKPGRVVHGVTPMHLAIGAQQGDMIQYLCSIGGSLSAPTLPKGTKASAPPLWLISKRWLSIAGDEVKNVVRVIRLLKQSGWNSAAQLNGHGDDMKSLIVKNLGGRFELQSALLAELDRCFSQL